MDAGISSHGIFQSLEAVARECQNAIAVVDSGEEISFADLLTRTSALCAEFGNAGLGPGHRAALLLPNSAAFVVSAFALWRAGAIVIPLHARLLEGELINCMKECGVRAILSTVRMKAVVESIQQQLGDVQHAWLWSSNSRAPQYVGSCPSHDKNWGACEDIADQPAVMQYSTGSTGHPKRVTRSHRQLLGEVECVSRLLGLGRRDKVLGAAPFFHSYGLANALLSSTLSGSQLFAAHDFFPRDIARLIEREHLTGFPGVPFMYQLLVELDAPADLRSLRYALSAGAPLLQSTAQSFKSKYGISVRQLYGTTETGVVSVEREDADRMSVGSVGQPIEGVSIRILDDSDQSAAGGVPGNIAITSPYAARKYEGSAQVGESFFKGSEFFPGDTGFLDSNRCLVLRGRRRGFINVSGNKVDPLEVETTLKQHPSVSDAVVLGVPDGAAGEKIKAVLVLNELCKREDIHAYCRGKLADFKRPRLIEIRKELPKSPVGKILRKYLIADHDGTGPDYVFDPRYGFSPVSGAKSGSEYDLGTLAPFLRTLLVTDGTITKMLEAFLWEPIDVELLLHTEIPSVGAHLEMVIVKEPILKRRVVLRGRITGSPYAFAETIVAGGGFSKCFQTMLVDGRHGIGELLRQHKLETYRELVSVERTHAGQWAGYLSLDTTARVSLRRYRICHQGKTKVQVTEVFPEDRFAQVTA